MEAMAPVRPITAPSSDGLPAMPIFTGISQIGENAENFGDFTEFRSFRGGVPAMRPQETSPHCENNLDVRSGTRQTTRMQGTSPASAPASRHGRTLSLNRAVRPGRNPSRSTGSQMLFLYPIRMRGHE